MTAHEDYWWRQRAADAAFAADTEEAEGDDLFTGIGEDEDDYPR
jgi:hypothetical protein